MTQSIRDAAQALLPCPFCGHSENIAMANTHHDHSGGYYIGCPECGASTDLVFALMDDPSQILAEKWNRRAALAAPAQSDDEQGEEGMSIPERLREIAARLRKPRDGRPWGADDGAADIVAAIAAELDEAAPAGAHAEPAGDPGMPVVAHVSTDKTRFMWANTIAHRGGLEAWPEYTRNLVWREDAQAAIASEREHASKLRETFLRMQSEHAAAIAARDEQIARLESAMAASCDEERQQLWEPGPGGTWCRRAGAAEARVRELESALNDLTENAAHADDVIAKAIETQAQMARMAVRITELERHLWYGF